MFKSITYQLYVYFFSAVFFIACTAAAWFSMPVILLAPFILLFCIWSIEQTKALFFILLLFIPWSAEIQFSDTLGTDMPDEPIMLLTSISVLCLCITQRYQINWKRLSHPLLFIILLQIAWLFISVCFSTHFLLSVKYLLAKGWYLLSFLVAPLLLFKDKDYVKKCGLGVFLSMLLLVVVTMFRHQQQGFTFATINDSLVPFFRNHVNYSAVLVFMLPIAVAVYTQTNKRILKRLLVIAILLLLSALYLSYARGAWLALLTGMGAFWLLRRKLLLQALLFLMALLFALFIWLQHNQNYLRFAHQYNTTIFHTDFEEHLVATYRLQDVSTAERFYRWIAGVRMIEDRWQTGYGPSTFYENYKPYAVPAFKTWVSNNDERSTVHNYFLLTFIEQGAIGFLLLLLLVIAFIAYAQKLYHASTNHFWKIVIATITVIFVMICTVNFLSDLIETDKVGSFYYMCIAILVIAERSATLKFISKNPNQA